MQGRPETLSAPSFQDHPEVIAFIQQRTRKGWRITNQNYQGIQMVKPKEWSKLLLILGLVTLIFGVGLVFLILAAIDYALRSDKNLYATYPEIIAGEVPEDRGTWEYALVGLLIIALGGLCYVMQLPV